MKEGVDVKSYRGLLQAIGLTGGIGMEEVENRNIDFKKRGK